MCQDPQLEIQSLELPEHKAGKLSSPPRPLSRDYCTSLVQIALFSHSFVPTVMGIAPITPGVLRMPAPFPPHSSSLPQSAFASST